MNWQLGLRRGLQGPVYNARMLPESFCVIKVYWGGGNDSCILWRLRGSRRSR